VAKKESRWFTYAIGGGVILLFCILLALRLGVPARHLSVPDTTLARPPRAIPTGETWMKITQNGRKIGHASRSLQARESGFSFSEELSLRINTMGIVQPLRVRTAADLAQDGTLSRFQFDLDSNLFRFHARGEVTGNRLTVRIGTPGEETTSVMDLLRAPYLGGGILTAAGAWELKPGQSRTVSLFDPASLGQREVQITLMGEEILIVMGKGRRAKKLSVDFMGMKQLAWIDADGATLREEGILGLVLERVTKENALAGIESAASADLTEFAAIPSSRPIDAPAKLAVLKVRLEGLAEVQLFLDGGRQAYGNGLMTIRRESLAGAAAQSPNANEDLSVFLRSSTMIQADHPKIRECLRQIVATGDPEGAKARKIWNWVYRNLEKRPVLSVPNALETLENRVGDCNEHAVLLTALARAAGIPADVEAGVVYQRGCFYYHAWNVLFIKEWGGWVTADATLGQLPADPTHIRFVRGALDRQLDLLGLIGKVRIEILETAQ
jgi:hypothetical protein